MNTEMGLKFAANLSFLFKEETSVFEERFALARDCGFHAVECGRPYNIPIETLKTASDLSGLEHVLINSYPGQTGDGFAALPGKKTEFRDSIELSIRYAQALGCKMIHVLAGRKDHYHDFESMEKTYKDNLAYTANRLEREGIMCLIEPINTLHTIPDYFLDNPDRAFDYVCEIDHPNLKYQLDIYHQQILAGNLTASIRKYWPRLGHVQVAQTPSRTEPGHAGEIDYVYIFKLLEELGWRGWIGLEHNCTKPTVDTLEFIKKLGYTL